MHGVAVPRLISSLSDASGLEFSSVRILCPCRIRVLRPRRGRGTRLLRPRRGSGVRLLRPLGSGTRLLRPRPGSRTRLLRPCRGSGSGLLRMPGGRGSGVPRLLRPRLRHRIDRPRHLQPRFLRLLRLSATLSFTDSFPHQSFIAELLLVRVHRLLRLSIFGIVGDLACQGYRFTC